MTRGINPNQLATLLRVSRGTIDNWESGKAPKVEADYVTRFQSLQVEAGEQPGFDSSRQVAEKWRLHLRGNGKR
jgi:hypothetical protein